MTYRNIRGNACNPLLRENNVKGRPQLPLFKGFTITADFNDIIEKIIKIYHHKIV